MADKLTRAILWILPVGVFVPLFVGSRLVLHPVPSSFDWILLIICAALVVFNPSLRQMEGTGTRVILIIVSFVGVMVLLFTLAFALMAVVFQDAL